MFTQFLERLIKNPFYLLLTVISVVGGIYLLFVGLLDLHFHSVYNKLYHRGINIPIESALDNRVPRQKTRGGDVSDTSYKTYLNSKIKELQNAVRTTKKLEGSTDLDKNNVTEMKILRLNSEDTSFESVKGSAIHMTEASPQKGYGKLAIRSFCDYCAMWLTIKVYSNDSLIKLLDEGRIEPKFNLLKKRETTYIKELPPGKYNVELNYGRQGTSNRVMEVFEGQASLYNSNKTNPFGDGMAQVVLTSNEHTRTWKISIDKKPLGNVTIQRGQGLFLNVNPGGHYITVEKIKHDLQSLDADFQQTYVDPSVGERIVKPIY